MNAVVTSAEVIAIELRALARARTPLQAYGTPTPGLDELSGVSGGHADARLEAIQAAIEASVPRLPPRAADAATALFPAEPALRWTALKQRGPEAAAAFETTYHAARTAPKAGGRSLLDDVALRLAEALIATADERAAAAESPADVVAIDLTGHRPDALVLPFPVRERAEPTSSATGAPSTTATDTVSGGSISAPTLPPAARVDVGRSRRPGSRKATRLLVVVVTAGVVVTGLWMTRRATSSDDPTAAERTPGPVATGASCAGRAGVAAQTASSVVADERLLSALADFARGRTDLDCPLGDAEVWGGLSHQAYRAADGRRLQLVAGPGTTSMEMPDAAFSAYFVAGGQSGNAAQALMGLPTGERRDPEGSVYSFSSGGLVIGARDDGPFFYLLKPAADEWNATGGWSGQLGAPTSLVWPWQGTVRQDFERGYLSITPTGSLERTSVPAGSSTLGTIERLEGHIVRQGDGTAWWIDSGGQRHWIADGPTWDCLGGQAAVAEDDVAGYSIDAVPDGPPASCP